MAHTKVDDGFVPHEDDAGMAFTKPPKESVEGRTFYVARVPMEGWDTTYAFTMKRRADGGISISDVQPGQRLSEQERHRLMAHFGGPLNIVTGGKWSEADGSTAHVTVNKKVAAGSIEHFLHAMYNLPDPFTLISKPEGK